MVLNKQMSDCKLLFVAFLSYSSFHLFVLSLNPQPILSGETDCEHKGIANINLQTVEPM